jgi:hypothetical protein
LQNEPAVLLEFLDQPRLARLMQLYFPKEAFESIVQVTFDNMKAFMCTRGNLLQESDTNTPNMIRSHLLLTLRGLVRDSLFPFIELEETEVPTPRIHITEKVVKSEEGTVQKRVYVFPKDLTRGVDTHGASTRSE